MCATRERCTTNALVSLDNLWICALSESWKQVNITPWPGEIPMGRGHGVILFLQHKKL